jgi:hypothetical protein
MKKTRIAVCALLILFSSLVALNALPVQATIPPLLDVFALKEYKQWSSVNPCYTFSKSDDSTLRMMSNDGGSGNAYAFMHIEKSYLNGKKLSIRWRWYYDWEDDYRTLAWLYVVNNIHNRKLIDSGEFRCQGESEHPISDFTCSLACSYAATSNGSWIDWRTDTSNVLDLSGFSSSYVTILIKNWDPWVADTVGLEVDYLQILDSNNNVLRTYHFEDEKRLVCMDKTDSYYDFGLVRRPSSMLYGTRNYADMNAPDGECDVSGGVSEYLYTMFYNTGKYGYLANSWGENTQRFNVNSTTNSMERYYDYSAVFYKGHIWQFGSNCNHDPGCPLVHYGIWNDDGTQGIADYEIDDEVIEAIDVADKFAGTHDFIFIWACGHANTTYVGSFNEAHSAGLLSSWMHLDPWTLDNDSYTSSNPDYSDHVFIGFEWFSIWYKTPTGTNPYNYAHWAYYFYDSLLNYGYTVEAALDRASELTHNGDNFGDCQLNEGFPLQGFEGTSRMRIWGDMSHRLPR